MKIGLVYGGCGSAAVAARNLGHEVVFNYEPRGKHFLDTFQLNFGNIKSVNRGKVVYITPHSIGYSYPVDIVIGQPDCKIFSALRTRKREVVSITKTQLYDFMVQMIQVPIEDKRSFIVENLPKGMDALMEYLPGQYDYSLSSGRMLDGGFCKKLFDYNLTRVDINAKDYLPQSRRRSFLIGTSLSITRKASRSMRSHWTLIQTYTLSAA